MKLMKRTFLPLLLILVLLLALFPAKTNAATEEFSEEFSKVLTDGKIVFNYVKPSSEDEAIFLIQEDFCLSNTDFYFSTDNFSDDFSKLELTMYPYSEKEEKHTVDVVWNYDSAVYEKAKSFIEKFPTDRAWFNVSDLELINYLVNQSPDSPVESLANYSGEFKAILGNTNFLFPVEIRAGADDTFSTARIGSAKLIHNNIVYFTSGYLGAQGDHVIYIPSDTADTKEALMAAAQKRIDDYIGAGVVEIVSAWDKTVTEYYNETVANYDTTLAKLQEELAAAQAIVDNEKAKDEELWDWNVINENELKIMDIQRQIENYPLYKQNFIDSFEEGGGLYFLKQAAGDYIFNVKVGDSVYNFIIIKDDTKLTVPSYTTVDLNTNVTIKTDSSSVPLDTIIELDKLTQGAEYDKIMEALDVKDNETFDISLYSSSLNDNITKLENDKFEVEIPIPEKFKGKSLMVYYVNPDGTTEEHEVTVNNAGNTATFTTDHFSIYTLAEAPGNVKHTGWEQVDGKWYFYNDDGSMSTGWNEINGKWYYMNAKGQMTTGWNEIGGKWYYMNSKGHMTTGWNEIDGKWYYMNAKGQMTTGWNEVGGKWYYMNSKGHMTTGWNEIGGKWYYMDTKGQMATGWNEVGGKWYYMNSKGQMTTGWNEVGGKWYYMNAKGQMTTGWNEIGGKWYFFKSGGAMATGWNEIDGKWYYMDTKSGSMKTGWLQLGTKWYYFNTKGDMVTGWKTIGNKDYFFNENGVWIK